MLAIVIVIIIITVAARKLNGQAKLCRSDEAPKVYNNYSGRQQKMTIVSMSVCLSVCLSVPLSLPVSSAADSRVNSILRLRLAFIAPQTAI